VKIVINFIPIWNWKTSASKIPQQSIGKYHIVKRKIERGATLPMNGVLGYDEALFVEDTIITVLREGERNGKDSESVWMSDSPYEYYSMWELATRVYREKVLIGGLGLGILANILSLRKDIKQITVVEISPEIIKMVKPYLPKRIEVIQGDFIRKMQEFESEDKKFDTIIADIWMSTDEESKEMFEDCKAVMEDYYPDAQHLFWAFQKEYDNDIAEFYFCLLRDEIRKTKAYKL